MTRPAETDAGLREAFLRLLIQHQRVPLYDGTPGQRCVGCDNLPGETDGPNSPRHAAHVADALAAVVAERGQSEGPRVRRLHEIYGDQIKAAFDAEGEAVARAEAAEVERDELRARLAERDAQVAAVEALAESLGHNHLCTFPDDECVCIQIEFRNQLTTALGPGAADVLAARDAAQREIGAREVRVAVECVIARALQRVQVLDQPPKGLWVITIDELREAIQPEGGDQ